MNNLTPLNQCVLVRLTESFGSVATPDKQYDTKTSGIVISVAETIPDFIIGNKVYFDDFKDGAKVTIDDEEYAFIKFDDIRGYENVTPE